MCLHSIMIQVSHQKLSPATILAFEEIGVDVWTGAIAEALEIGGIVHLRAVSKSFSAMMMSDELWLDRLTLLSLSNPVLADLDRGAEETAYAWYVRCHAAVDDGHTLARRHKESGIAYLQLYGMRRHHKSGAEASMCRACVRVRTITLLGLLIGVKDTNRRHKLAFGLIYDALSVVNEQDIFVDLPWAPQLPITGKWELREIQSSPHA
jgi:hypothetical protein